MRQYPVSAIPPGSFFSEPVYLEKRFILAAPEMPFTREMAEALAQWEYDAVYSLGEPMEDYAANKTEEAEGKELADAANLADNEKMIRAERFYSGLVRYIEDLFSEVIVKNRLDYKSVAEKIKDACDVIREDRRFLLRVQRNQQAGLTGDYLASHSAKSMIISIIIGSYLKLPVHRLIELGIAALLHEIGMTKLPPPVYLSMRKLEPRERQAILSHPVLGYNLLKSFDFPLNITLAALEHHERENGSGYPRRLTGDRISLYSKIIAVACSYEALSAQRPHKEAKDGYTGMLELLKNEGKQYDDTVVRALVYSLSIYPIGLYVLLSSGRKGQVVDVNPESPRFPIVQVFGELTPDGKNKVIQTAQAGITIVRPLKEAEINSE